MPDTQPTISTAAPEQPAPPQVRPRLRRTTAANRSESPMDARIATLEQRLCHTLGTGGTWQRIGTLQAELGQDRARRAALQGSVRVMARKGLTAEWKYQRAMSMGRIVKDLLARGLL